jgi:hypothetical protein
MKTPLHIGFGIILSVMVFTGTGLAEQVRFADWIGIEETDSSTNTKYRQIGTFVGNQNNALWLAVSTSGRDRIQLTLKSDKMMASNYYSYRIDKVDTLALRSAEKGCNGNCLIDEVEKNGELIRTMRRGLRINVEYESSPDLTQKPTFSLRGFSRAYQWMLAE